MLNQRKLLIAFTLFLYPIFGFGQIINEINFDLGFNGNTYKIKSKKGFTNTSDAAEISLFMNLTGRKKINNAAFDFGFGVNKEYLNFNPFIKLNNIKGFENYSSDTLIIAEVGNWVWQFQIPLSYSYRIFDQKDKLFPLPEIRVITGITNKFTFHRINTDNIIISDYNEERQYGFEYYNKNLNRRVSEYYSKKIDTYRLLFNLGLEFLYINDSTGVRGGLKYNRYLMSPMDSEINNKFSIILYIGVYFDLWK